MLGNLLAEPEIRPVLVEKPCAPSPCGPNSLCQEAGNNAVCSCRPGYFGSPPDCRPECVSNAECSPQKACINQKCEDPCPGTCGQNAECRIINHNPICSCTAGYTGDAYSRCQIIPSKHGDLYTNITNLVCGGCLTVVLFCF